MNNLGFARRFFVFAFRACAFTLLASLGTLACTNAAGPSKAPAAAATGASAPSISPSGGKFPDSTLLVTISSDAAGAFIYWTDDGTEPTTRSNLYSEPIRIWGSSAIRAMAVVGDSTSGIAQANLTLNEGKGLSSRGIIKGHVSVDASAGGVALDTINIFSDQLPGVVKRADATGFFVFDGLDSAKAYTIYFTNQDVGPIRGSRKIAPLSSASRAAGGAAIVANQLSNVLPAEGSGLDLGSVLLRKTGTISGYASMVDRDGNKVADSTGIDVYVPGTSFGGKTDAEGHFTLYFIPQGSYHVRAEKAGYTFKEVSSVSVAPDADTAVNAADNPLQIHFGLGTVTGQALLRDGSSSGLPCDGIAVLLRNLVDATATFNTVTGADGSYTVSNVEPGSYIAFFSKTGYVSQTAEGLAVEGAKVAKVPVVSLPAVGGSISGRVPIQGTADLSGTIIIAHDAASGKTFSTGTTLGGAYSLDPVAPGTYAITASHSGYGTQTLSNVVLASGSALPNMDFPELKPAFGTITGTVALEGASDFNGIGVTIRKSDDASVSYSALTDAQGVYIFTALTPGSYLLLFAKDGFLPGDGATATLLSDGVVTAGAATLRSSKARLSGSATLESLSDHAGIAVLATGDNGTSYSTVTDAAGHWALAGMDTGSYTVQASKDGYVTARSDPISLGAGANDSSLVQALKVSLRSLVGKVVLEEASSASGVKITATNIGDLHKIYSALSNNDGYYVLAGMTPGAYILSFSKENYKGLTTNSVSLDATTMVTLDDITLQKARGGISGIALSQGRTDNSGARVLLVGTAYETTTDASGVYAFQVPSGNYPGGVRFERADFQTSADAETITVLTDSTYGVPSLTLAATHNSAIGRIDLINAADDGIAVAIDAQAGFQATTAADGAWRIDHIPLGSYTVRFSKANTPDVTSALAVVPADIVDLGTIQMIPNASTLAGYIRLSGMSDYSGILVTVATPGKPDCSALTNAAGRFTVDNILSTGSHAVTAAKAGWDSWTSTISDFQPLEKREIGSEPAIIMIDTTLPVVSGVVINEGANITDNPAVTLRFSLAELGSGPDRMQVSWDGVFDVEPWEPYAAAFSKTVPANGNGDYTVKIRVRDKAGNISASASDSITLSNLNRTLSGVLKGEDLHWSKARGIYKVVGTMVVEPGDTLVVDPGVEVQFTGDFSLAVRGTIQVRGTKNDIVIFTRDPAYAGQWTGIALQGEGTVRDGYTYQSGSIFEYAKVSYAKTAISSTIGLLIQHNRFDETNGTLKSGAGDVFFNNDVSCIFELDGNTTNSNFHDIVGSGTGYWNWRISGFARNNTFTAISSPDYYPVSLSASSFSNNAIHDFSYQCQSAFISYASYWYGAFATSGGDYSFNNIFDIWSSHYLAAPNNVGQTIKAANNFWGDDRSAELSLLGAGGNASFLYDYYDDPINLAKIQYTPYASTPWDFAGYKGEAFIDADFGINGYDFSLPTQSPIAEPSTPNITLQVKVPYHNNPISSVRIAQSVNNLMAASWSGYSASQSWTIDTGKLVDGYAELYLQVKDDQGNVSGIASHRIAYDSPTISKLSALEGMIFTTEADYSFKYSLRDAGKLVRRELLLNGIRIADESAPWGVGGSGGTEASNTQRLLIKDMGNGSYTLTTRATDETGRSTSVDTHFSISRTVDRTDWGAGASWDASTGQPLKDAGTLYLWHLGSDASEAGADPVNTLTNYTGGSGGLGGGSAASMYSGSTMPLNFSQNAFTVEWWQKAGNGSIQLQGGPISNCYQGSLSWNYVVGNGSSSDYCNPYTPDNFSASWHHVAFVFKGDRALVYFDGVPASFKDGFTQTLFDNGSKLFLYASGGSFDELRISTRARSGDEILEYVTQATPKLQ